MLALATGGSAGDPLAAESVAIPSLPPGGGPNMECHFRHHAVPHNLCKHAHGRRGSWSSGDIARRRLDQRACSHVR